MEVRSASSCEALGVQGEAWALLGWRINPAGKGQLGVTAEPLSFGDKGGLCRHHWQTPQCFFLGALQGQARWGHGGLTQDFEGQSFSSQVAPWRFRPLTAFTYHMNLLLCLKCHKKALSPASRRLTPGITEEWHLLLCRHLPRKKAAQLSGHPPPGAPAGARGH